MQVMLNILEEVFFNVKVPKCRVGKRELTLPVRRYLISEAS